MATKKKRPVNHAYLGKEPSEVHSGFADYIEATTGFDLGDYSGELSPVVALVQRLYPLYLKSPSVAKARAADKAARDAEKASKDEAKRGRLQARLDKIEEQRQKLLTDLGLADASGIPDSPIVVVESADRFVENKEVDLSSPEPEEVADDDVEDDIESSSKYSDEDDDVWVDDDDAEDDDDESEF